MKIATVLSVSALLAMFSVVACSTAPAATGDKKSGETAGDDDDDDSAKAPKKTTTSTPAASTPASNTSTSTAGATDATCDACASAASPKAAAMLKCEATCKDDDDACFEKCDTDNCGAPSPDNECSKAFASCEAKCPAETPPTDDEIKACDTCIGSDTKAQAALTCLDGAKSDADADKCFEPCDADMACSATLDKCADKCGLNSVTCR